MTTLPRLVVTVCDQAHEALAADDDGWLHWSVRDPVAVGTRAAFDATLDELRTRIELLLTDPKADPPMWGRPTAKSSGPMPAGAAASSSRTR